MLETRFRRWLPALLGTAVLMLATAAVGMARTGASFQGHGEGFLQPTRCPAGYTQCVEADGRFQWSGHPDGGYVHTTFVKQTTTACGRDGKARKLTHSFTFTFDHNGGSLKATGHTTDCADKKGPYKDPYDEIGGTFHFSGGTGRFAGAAGSAHYSTNLLSGAESWLLAGSINR